jgi:hypothetical protein
MDRVRSEINFLVVQQTLPVYSQSDEIGSDNGSYWRVFRKLKGRQLQTRQPNLPTHCITERGAVTQRSQTTGVTLVKKAQGGSTSLQVDLVQVFNQ